MRLMAAMTKKQLRRFFPFFTVVIVLSVALGVWVTHQFPALTNGPKSSVEILESLFEAPARMVSEPTEYVLQHIRHR